MLAVINGLVPAVELGAAWADTVAQRECLPLKVANWPDLHIQLQHKRPERECRTPEAHARQRASADALVRLCYDAARTRYAELAAWRLT
jgi:hypothetical protein